MLLIPVALLFSASSAWSGTLQNVTVSSPGALELHPYTTAPGTLKNDRDSGGNSPEVTTDASDRETTNTCFDGNGSDPGNLNASGETSSGSDEDVATIRSVESYWTYIVGLGINRYVLPVIVVVGVFGNLVSMTIMFQRQNRRSSFSVYLGALAISDTCVLFGSAYYWVITDILRRPFTDIECKILTWWLITFQE